MAPNRRVIGGLSLILGSLAITGPLVGPVVADRLVTRDGNVVRTQGPWKIDGKLVVFSGLDGELRSIRLTEVDLEQSQLQTRNAAESRRLRRVAASRQAPEVVPAKTAVLVLTDADVRHVSKATSEAADGADSDREAEAPAASRALEVTSWNQTIDNDGTRITGTLGNVSDFFIARLSLDVSLTNSEGSAIGSSRASLERGSLAAGESTLFVARFPTVFEFQQASFKPRGLHLGVQEDEPSTANGE